MVFSSEPRTPPELLLLRHCPARASQPWVSRWGSWRWRAPRVGSRRELLSVASPSSGQPSSSMLLAEATVPLRTSGWPGVAVCATSVATTWPTALLATLLLSHGFALTTLRMFNEEMERVLCGEQDSWASKKLEDHIKFEHGYEANSPSVISILREFEREEQRAFIQFTTGAPQLPLGGLASLDPKLTVVPKQCDGNVDNE